VGPGCQPTLPVSETKIGEAHATARRRLFRRRQWYQHVHLELSSLKTYLAWPIADDQDGGGGHGGAVVRPDGEASTATEIAQLLVTPSFPNPT